MKSEVKLLGNEGSTGKADERIRCWKGNKRGKVKNTPLACKGRAIKDKHRPVPEIISGEKANIEC